MVDELDLKLSLEVVTYGRACRVTLEEVDSLAGCILALYRGALDVGFLSWWDSFDALLVLVMQPLSKLAPLAVDEVVLELSCRAFTMSVSSREDAGPGLNSVPKYSGKFSEHYPLVMAREGITQAVIKLNAKSGRGRAEDAGAIRSC